MKIFANIYT